MMKKNGRKLTEQQIKKVGRIDRLIAELKAEGVRALVIDGGGSTSLTFWRNADLDLEILQKHFLSGSNVSHTSDTKLGVWNP
jgi:hypothetical protein